MSDCVHLGAIGGTGGISQIHRSPMFSSEGMPHKTGFGSRYETITARTSYGFGELDPYVNPNGPILSTLKAV